MNIISPPRTEASNGLVDSAANVADDAIRSTQRVANQALDGLAGSVEGMRQKAAPLLTQASEQAGALAQRGMNTVLDTSHQLRDRALRASDTTVSYIKDEPVKAMLIAAATGAALMALVGLMSRTRH
jgi:ElaB/YqjD/DUF883 family membrane-anchored ribosome-binding protein